MRNFFISLFAIVAIAASAQTNDDAVSMVSYEQTWLDDVGTLALKNNTSNTITSVDFTIEYLNMQGVQLDYKTFQKKVTIEPGKTRKINIPAYERERDYNYYKSKGKYNGEAFKIRFELNGVNGGKKATSANESPGADPAKEATGAASTNKSSSITAAPVAPAASKKTIVNKESVTSEKDDVAPQPTELPEENPAEITNFNSIVGLVTLLFFIGIYSGLYVMVVVMAKKRNRSAAGWLFLSFFITPLVACIILLAVGVKYEY